MRKWLIRILIVLAVVPMLGAAVLQLYLWSDGPRKLVLRELQDTTGLSISIGSLETGWSGHTILRTVTVAETAADELMIDVHRLSVHHTSLIFLLLGRPLVIESLEIDKPGFRVDREDSGTWNIVRAYETATAEMDRESRGSDSPAPVPSISVRNGTLALSGVSDRVIDMASITLRGFPESSGLWNFEAESPGVARISGHVATDGSWTHDLVVDISDGARFLPAPWKEALSPCAVTCSWNIDDKDNAWHGRIEIDRLRLADMELHGESAIVRASAFRLENPTLTIRRSDSDADLVDIHSSEVRIENHVVSVKQLRAELPQGTVQGHLDVPIESWTHSRGELKFDEVDVGRLLSDPSSPAWFRGLVSGALTIEPTSDRRAPEPMEVRLSLQTRDMSIESMRVDDIDAVMFAGPNRVVLDRAATRIGDGSVTFWGRLTRHNREFFAHLNADVDHLSLQQLATAFHSEAEEMAGFTRGRVTIAGYLQSPHRSFGQANLEVIDADLARVPLLSTLYNALNLKILGSKPEGSGTLSMRLENDNLEVSRFEYFNRGTDVLAHGRIESIWLGAASPVSGFAVAAARPLKKINLPIFRDFDQVLKAVQSDTGAVRITGTLGNYDVKPVPFADVRGALKAIVSGSRN